MINLAASHFFLPTKNFRMLTLLLIINEGKRSSQHAIAEQAGLSSAMVNGYVKQFIKDGYLSVERINKRDCEYSLTSQGRELLTDHLMACSAEIVQLYAQAQEEIVNKLRSVFAGSAKVQVALFGGSQTARFVLSAIEQFPQVLVTAIVDNDQQKWGQVLGRHVIQSPEILEHMNFQHVIVASFAKQNEIADSLQPYKERGVQIIKLTSEY